MPRPSDSGLALYSCVVLSQREVQEAVPVSVYLLGHRLLFSPVFACYLRGLRIPCLLCEALEKLVGGYLHMLGCVAVSRVLARLIPTDHIGRTLEQGTC
jgi:hypothetical protein